MIVCMYACIYVGMYVCMPRNVCMYVCCMYVYTCLRGLPWYRWKQTVSYGVRKSRGELLGVYAKETRCPQRVGNILQGEVCRRCRELSSPPLQQPHDLRHGAAPHTLSSHTPGSVLGAVTCTPPSKKRERICTCDMGLFCFLPLQKTSFVVHSNRS
jgi:hypothetical protein